MNTHKKSSCVYHAWKTVNGKCEDVKDFCRSEKIAEIVKNGLVLTRER